MGFHPAPETEHRLQAEPWLADGFTEIHLAAVPLLSHPRP